METKKKKKTTAKKLQELSKRLCWAETMNIR